MPALAELIILLICSGVAIGSTVVVIVIIIIYKNKKANADAEETVDQTPSEHPNDHF